jgi:hypothetical protein
MNTKGHRALWIGVAVIVCMGLVPPWCQNNGDGTCLRSIGYQLILDPPYAGGIDLSRLLIQWFLVVVVVGAYVVTAKGGGRVAAGPISNWVPCDLTHEIVRPK